MIPSDESRTSAAKMALVSVWCTPSLCEWQPAVVARVRVGIEPRRVDLEPLVARDHTAAANGEPVGDRPPREAALP